MSVYPMNEQREDPLKLDPSHQYQSSSRLPPSTNRFLAIFYSRAKQMFSTPNSPHGFGLPSDVSVLDPFHTPSLLRLSERSIQSRFLRVRLYPTTTASSSDAQRSRRERPFMINTRGILGPLCGIENCQYPNGPHQIWTCWQSTCLPPSFHR